jgi:hypothetical protein
MASNINTITRYLKPECRRKKKLYKSMVEIFVRIYNN